MLQSADSILPPGIVKPILEAAMTEPENMAPSSAMERGMTITGKIPYTEGIAPIARRELPGYDSGVMTLLICLFLFITLNLRHYSTFLKTFAQNLFSVRKRANVFDERSTMSETRVLASLILLTCVRNPAIRGIIPCRNRLGQFHIHSHVKRPCSGVLSCGICGLPHSRVYLHNAIESRNVGQRIYIVPGASWPDNLHSSTAVAVCSGGG